MTKVVRLTKGVARDPNKGSFREREVRKGFKKVTQVKTPRMCRGCAKPKDQCDCPRSCLEASIRYNVIIEAMRDAWEQEDAAERKRKAIKRRRAKIKIVT
jgi:hypothetical protein